MRRENPQPRHGRRSARVRKDCHMKNWFVVLSTLIVVFSGTAYAAALGATTDPVSGTYAYVSGSPLIFTVTASGGTGPYLYKWAKNGTSSYLPGETASTLTIDPVATGNAGTYYAEITDSVPAVVTSTPIVVTITTEVSIYADEITIAGLNLTSNLVPVYLTTEYSLTNAKTQGTFLIVDTNGDPISLEFHWIASKVVMKRITYIKYQVPIFPDTMSVIGPLPKELVSTDNIVTFTKLSTGSDTTNVKPFVVSP